MAKFTTVKCWHVTSSITDPDALKQGPPSFSIVKKSILKTGYRGFAIEEREEVESQDWYKPFLLGDEVRFYLDGSGVYRLANCDLTENELYFERLNVPVGCRPWIFNSWQSDYNPSRGHINDALESAVKYINENCSPKEPLELVSPSRPDDGADNIVDTIKRNIDQCIFSVFDITNVAKVGDKDGAKCHPNANVVYELSYALTQKLPAQVLLVKKNRKSNLPSDEVPFDFAQNKYHTYERPTTLKTQVQDILIKYLRIRNYIQVDD